MPSATRPVLSVDTPKTSKFPSEILALQMPGIAGVIKQEDDMKTPITPPSAYTDFLKALTPVLVSPRGSLVRSFSTSDESSGKDTPSTDGSSEPSTATSFAFSTAGRDKSLTVSVPPPTPQWPQSATTPNSRRYLIPQSPLHTATGVSSPSPWSACSTRSPFDWNIDPSKRCFEVPRSTAVRPVSVRSVVTRTVTYKRTPLDPAPKGKKRKISEEPIMPPPPSSMPTATLHTASPPTAVV